MRAPIASLPGLEGSTDLGLSSAPRFSALLLLAERASSLKCSVCCLSTELCVLSSVEFSTFVWALLPALAPHCPPEGWWQTAWIPGLWGAPEVSGPSPPAGAAIHSRLEPGTIRPRFQAWRWDGSPQQEGLRDTLTSGALTVPKVQVNTESATSLQIEEDESETQTNCGPNEHLRPKRSAQNSAQKGHTAQWRDEQQAFQRGNHISQGGHEGNRESGSSSSQVSAARKCTAGATWNPHQASETQVGWEAALPWLGPHIWAREESWGQQQGRDRCGEMPQSRASQLPNQQPHIMGLQLPGQGVVQNQDLEEQQQPTVC